MNEPMTVQSAVIGETFYRLNHVITAHIVTCSANGHPNQLEVLTNQGMLTLYDGEAMVMWDLLTYGALNTADSLARYQEEVQRAFEAEAQAQIDLDQQPQTDPDQYTYVYTPEDVQTYLNVSRTLDRVDRDLQALVEQELAVPDDLRTWSIIAQALEHASDHIHIVDWEHNRVELDRLPGETPHGQWRKWMDDDEAATYIAQTLTYIERQNAGDV